MNRQNNQPPSKDSRPSKPPEASEPRISGLILPSSMDEPDASAQKPDGVEGIHIFSNALMLAAVQYKMKDGSLGPMRLLALEGGQNKIYEIVSDMGAGEIPENEQEFIMQFLEERQRQNIARMQLQGGGPVPPEVMAAIRRQRP